MTLEQRIANALTDNTIRSGDLADLITEAESAAAEAETAAEQARVRSLDPVASPDTEKARAAMESAAFRRDRLRAALPRLHERHKQIRVEEDCASWQQQYEPIKAEQAALAAELTELYPEFVAKLTNLLQRIEAADTEERRISITRPPAARGDGRHGDTEAMARGGAPAWGEGILRDLKLPAWKRGAVAAWPAPAPLPAIAMPITPPITAESWPAMLDQRHRQRVEESKRAIAGYDQRQRDREKANGR